jgi:lantibiotic biosynthesis protein
MSHPLTSTASSPQAETLESALWDIVRDLGRVPTDVAHPGSQLDQARHEALLFTHLYDQTHDRAFLETANAKADECADLMARLPLPSSLYHGVAGVGWLFAHMERLGVLDVPCDLDDIDDLLITNVRANPTQRFDLVSGLTGIGVHFLERPPSASRDAGIDAVVSALATTAERSTDGACWLTRPEWVPAHARDSAPDGRYDLGVAHGAPGVIALLALVACSDGARPTTSGLLRDATRWLLAQERKASDGVAFGASIGRPQVGAVAPARTAWCYGDPGIAIALSLSGEAMDDSVVTGKALEVAQLAARRSETEAGVHDASLCHGAAGLAHVFRVLAKMTGDALTRHAAARWLSTTLKLRRAGQGIGGFQYRDIRSDQPPAWTDDRSFLQGGVGIALALSSALWPDSDSSWHRLLLLG